MSVISDRELLGNHWSPGAVGSGSIRFFADRLRGNRDEGRIALQYRELSNTQQKPDRNHGCRCCPPGLRRRRLLRHLSRQWCCDSFIAERLSKVLEPALPQQSRWHL